MNVVDSLKRLGLSDNQAKIYLFATEHPESRIGNIVRGTGIPRTSVYQNISGLIELGLVEEAIDQGAIRIKAYPVSILRHKFVQKQEELGSLITETERLERSINALAKESSHVIKVRYYKGVSGARQLFWNTLRAKGIVLVYSAFGRSKFVGRKFYAEFVKESFERNFKERVLINPTSRALEMIKKDRGSALARTSPKNIRCLDIKDIKISGETFIYDNIFAVAYLREKEIVGFEIESQDFVESQKSIFETLWKRAMPVTTFV